MIVFFKLGFFNRLVDMSDFYVDVSDIMMINKQQLMALTCFNNKILTSGGRNIPPYIGKTIQRPNI